MKFIYQNKVSKLSYGYWRRKIGIYNKYEKTVKNIYNKSLKRQATDDEIEHFGIMLENNKIDHESIIKLLDPHADLRLSRLRDEIIKDAYMDVLKRPATDDEISFLKTMFGEKKMDKNHIHKILLNPDELKLINDWTHYSVKYWNDLPAVMKYINKCATDNPSCRWIEDIMIRFSEYVPFENVLVIGCGNGWLERHLYQIGVGKHFDAFDISEEYIKEAEKQKKLFFNGLNEQQKEKRTDLNGQINYFVLDINKLENLKAGKYDAVFNYAVLHHVEDLESVTRKIRQLMKVNGLIFNVEYIGPNKNQYSEQHIATMEQVLKKIPEKFRTPHTLKPHIQNFRVDPSEALHSSMIKHTIENFFDVIFQRNLNGGVAYPLLWNFINKFENIHDQKSADCLDFLLKEDELQSKSGQVPILFWYGVGKNNILTKDKSIDISDR